MSNGCTELSDVTTLSGFSEGGFAAVVGGFAFRQLGLEIWQSFIGGAPLNAVEQFKFIYGTVFCCAFGLLLLLFNTVGPACGGECYLVFVGFLNLLIVFSPHRFLTRKYVVHPACKNI